MNKKKKHETDMQETIDTLTKWAVNMAIATATMKVVSDAYKDNPSMFWSYMRQKNENMIFNCRM